MDDSATLQLRNTLYSKRPTLYRFFGSEWEDVLQYAILVTATADGVIPDPGAFAWGVIKNTRLKKTRSSGREIGFPEGFTPSIPSFGGAVEEENERAYRVRRVMDVLDRLTVCERDVVKSWLAGTARSEQKVDFQMDENRTRNVRYRALQKLRSAVEPNGTAKTGKVTI